MTRNLTLVTLLLIALLVLVGAACSGQDSSNPQERYQCPMHPTVVSDRPGECPICHMDLVLINHERTGQRESSAPPNEQAPLFYRNPMDPTITSPTPMKDSMGMDYVAVYPGDAGTNDAVIEGRTAVSLDAIGNSRAGIRTEPVRSESLGHSIRTVGVVAADETRVHHLHLKVSGFIEQLYVAFEGQVVREGQPMLTVYSPELLASQEEFLRAHAAAQKFASSALPEVRQGGNDLYVAARRRLELLDVPASLITLLERSGSPQRSVTIYSPHSGFVTAKDVYEGMQVEPGSELFTITDLSHVWIEADVFEAEAPLVAQGLPASLTLPYDASITLTGKVAYIFPTFRAETRTLRVRFDFPNPQIRLKPGMFANVEMQLAPREALTIPDSAVIDTGTRQLVFVKAASGDYLPREVKLGVHDGRRVEVLFGLTTADEIVVEGNFLLDSESRLKAAISSASAEQKSP